MLYFIITVLGVSLILYVLLAGADFGAGILELFSGKKDMHHMKNLTYKAIGPVWEANHIWIILIIVILFMGFPGIYATISTSLHLPLLLMLLGIIARGSAFAFRHYDAIKDEKSQQIYTEIFAYSSFFTPLFLGISAGAIASGEITPDATHFYEGFIAGWLNAFAISVGIFTAAICGYLAAVYMIGESTEEKMRYLFIKRAKNSNVYVVLAGLMVFTTAYFDNADFIQNFLNPYSLTFLGLSTIMLPVFWHAINWSNSWWARLIAAFQVSSIILAWGAAQFPNIILLSDGQHLSFFNTQAPTGTLKALTIALITGVLIIVPFLSYLFYTFNKIRVR